MFEYGTASVLYGEQSLETACREIAGLGIRHLDLWHVDGWCEHLAGGIDAVRATLDRHDMKLESISVYGAALDKVKHLLDCLHVLGGHALVMGSPGPDTSVEAFAKQVAPLADYASRLGVTLAIENHGSAVIDSTQSMIELMDMIPAPGLGIALAPIHLHRRSESTADAIRALKERVALMYLWDWGPSADAHWKDPAEQFVGTGVIQFPPIIEALLEIGYDRPLDIFAHGPEHWPPAKTTERLKIALDTARKLEAEARA